jgi:hypothetical protein
LGSFPGQPSVVFGMLGVVQSLGVNIRHALVGLGKVWILRYGDAESFEGLFGLAEAMQGYPQQKVRYRIVVDQSNGVEGSFGGFKVTPAGQ